VRGLFMKRPKPLNEELWFESCPGSQTEHYEPLNFYLWRKIQDEFSAVPFCLPHPEKKNQNLQNLLNNKDLFECFLLNK